MKKNRLVYVLILVSLIFGSGYFFLNNCGYLLKKPAVLERVKKDGPLVVITRNAPTTYYEGPEGPMGYEHDLVMAFADYVGVDVQFKILDSITEILHAIEEGKGDIAAAALTRTDNRDKKFLFGPDYHTVQQQVVCRRGRKHPKKIDDLPNFEIMVIKDSSYEEVLHNIKAHLPNLKWSTTSDLSTEQILKKVWMKEIDCTVADSNIVAINRRYYPELVVSFSLTEKQPLAWVLNPKRKYLKRALEYFIEEFEKNGGLVALKERYYGHVKIFDYVDTKTYHRRIKDRLPLFEPLFREASKKYNIPWTLLAAQAYQESHWDEKAKSPTGVRGIMMLTRRTAQSLGIDDRLDPSQSIMGGAKYLSQLLRRVPEKVKGEDRIWFALAAYNVGMGHMYDAQTLAKRFGKNPYVWNDIKTVLPMLSQKQYYKTLKYGYARGEEPIRYVERIRDFKDILENQINEKGLL